MRLRIAVIHAFVHQHLIYALRYQKGHHVENFRVCDFAQYRKRYEQYLVVKMNSGSENTNDCHKIKLHEVSNVAVEESVEGKELTDLD